MSAKNENPAGDGKVTEYVTVAIADQWFGLPIARVQDVFKPDRLTRVPLAAPEIAGVLNLRGRIVTAIDMRCRLGLPPREAGKQPMAVGVACEAESYGLLVDAVGEVIKLADDLREPNPINLDRTLAHISAGVHRRDQQLMVVLDLDRVLTSNQHAVAA
jgi:purine-binding chemotaxis protein CheW